MRANYGFQDASGEFYITIDTDKCDGCGDCLTACPEGILELVPDDYQETKAAVKPEFGKSLSHSCLGYHARCSKEETNCHAACNPNAIEHSW